tara:strand:- start:206 stop:757 length:552 start_codon:yes stop_codon:yes gene_type:complete
MAKHVLSLEAPDTMNDCLLRVIDTSVYNPDIDIICPLLEITLPGFKYPVQFDESTIQPGFMLNLTACDLDVQIDGCGTTFNRLPDGIYVIKYSVSPNEFVYVEYNHLRITQALNQYQAILCELDLSDCEPSVKVKEKMMQLRTIRMYLDAAKAKVEFCHEPKKGMELYKYAMKLLGKFDCKSC